MFITKRRLIRVEDFVGFEMIVLYICTCYVEDIFLKTLGKEDTRLIGRVIHLLPFF